MDIAWKEILEFPVLRSAHLRTVKSWGDRRVRWVSVIEMPVEDFVREDEFVLTSAMGCNEAPKLLEQLVCDVAASKAAALGIATGYYIPEIPARVIALAEERELPILEIPWEVRFSEIGHAVSDALRKAELGTLEAAQEIQADVLDLILRGASPADVATAISRRLQMPTLIADARGEVVGRGSGSHRLEELFREAQGTASPDAPHPTPSVPVEIPLHGCRLLQYPIGSTQGVDGYLVLHDTSKAGVFAFGWRERQMVEHAATACAFWFLNQSAMRGAEMRSRAAFIWNLAKGQIAPDEALSTGARLGLHLERRHICIVGHADNQEEEGVAGGGVLDRVDRVHHAVEEVIARASEALGLRVVLSYQRETFLVYVEATEDEALQPAHRLLDRVDRQLLEVMPRLVISWGIASQQPGAAAFAAGYKAALEALDIGYRQNGVGHRTAAREVRLYRTLLRIAEDPEVQEFVRELLDRLADYDHKKGGELVVTLSTFLRTRGQISETARLLNLHRQSLVYRINKIESLTGRSLSDPENWFLFGLAIRIATLKAAQAPHARA